MSRLRASLCAVAAAALAAQPAWAQPPSPPPTPRPAALRIDVGRASDFSRLEFRLNGAPAIVRHAMRDGVLVLRIDGATTADLARLHVDPPPFITGVESSVVNGALELRLRLAENTDYRVGQADGATFVNLSSRSPAAVAAAGVAASAPALPRAEPAPPGGVVPVGFAISGADAVLTFRWNAPAGAAVFRRGDAVWIVFDAAARLDAAAIPRGLRQVTAAQALQGPGWSALRLSVPANLTATPSADGPVWTVHVGPGLTAPAQSVSVGRAERGGPSAVQAALGGVSAVRWIEDPAVRDRLAVATALGPARGVAEARGFVDFSVLSSTQGVAVAPVAGDLIVRADGDFVTITRPSGLAVSTVADSRPRDAAGAGLPQPAAMPALISADWARAGRGGFLARQAELQRLAAAEGRQGTGAASTGRLALARFLAGNGLHYEAIGVLNALVRSNQGVLASAEVRGLRGAMRAMVGRVEEAQADFASPVLSDDPSSALWRGWIAVQHSDWSTARQQFEAGRPALTLATPLWRARFQRAEAQAALGLGDRLAAWTLCGQAVEVADPADQLQTRLLQARILVADGQKDVARRIYEAVATAPVDSLAAPALLHATELQLEAGAIPPQQAVATFDGLRYRWRGDETELEVIRALGRLYLGQGRYREALETLRSAGNRLPNLPASVELQRDLGSAFRGLFLDGAADLMQPVQALALFYDFRDLTPIGADGDLMVRRLSDRLVAVDLLDQAAELLAYQVNNRLDGVAKAQVATDLATLYLMNRRAQDALVAINSSRTTVLPADLNARRHVVEARALTQLGRYDNALEVLADSTAPDAQDLRAEIAWQRHDWPQAAQRLEALLGERWRQPGPLDASAEQRLLRAAVGYSLANDETSLARLRERWRGFVDGASAPDALRVALAGPSAPDASASFGRVVAEIDTFSGWVQRMRTELANRAAAPADAPPPTQVAAPAAQTPPPAQAAVAAPASAAPRG